MSRILRHEPEKFGVKLSREGFALLDRVVEALQKRWPQASREDICELVKKDSKGRFELQGSKIRATYGHTVPVSLDYPTIVPQEFFYHGTSKDAAEQILKVGLKPMGRQAVHLSTSPKAAYLVGRRKSEAPVVLTILAREAHARGISFQKIRETVLAKVIPPEFIQLDLGTLLEAGKNLFLMGRPGVGKTTLIQKVLAGLSSEKVGGFYTEELRGEEGARKGFRIKTTTGKSEILAEVGLESPVRVGRYGVNLAGIERVINPELEAALRKAELLVLDEIGKMETASQGFKALVEKALDSPVRVLATIPAYRLSFVEALKRSREVVLGEVTRENRDLWPRAILSRLARV